MNKKMLQKEFLIALYVISLMHYLLGRSEVFVFGLAKATEGFFLTFFALITKKW